LVNAVEIWWKLLSVVSKNMDHQCQEKASKTDEKLGCLDQSM